MSHEETVGDLFEAVLGYYYILTVRQNICLDFIVDDFIVMLERAIICVYVKNYGIHS